MSQTTEILEFIQTLVLKIHHLEAELNAANEFIEISSEGAKSFQASFDKLLEQYAIEEKNASDLTARNKKLERKVKRQNNIIEILRGEVTMLTHSNKECCAQIEGFRTILKNHEIGVPTWLLT